MNMINLDHLHQAENARTASLKTNFPNFGFTLTPYYAGMGHCGFEIIVKKKDGSRMTSAEKTAIDKYYWKDLGDFYEIVEGNSSSN